MKNEKWALITGCTSGIGKAFADLLAEKGFSLVLVSRNEEKLKALSDELKCNYKINTFIIREDLEKEGAAHNIYEKLQREGVQIQILVNNAGFNECGAFLETNTEKELEMVQLHIVFTTEMMKLFLPEMVRQGNGRVLNVGSTGSYIPCPYDAVYAATKAYLLSVSKGINAELKKTGVSITTLCPGSTRTEFAHKAGMEETLLFKIFVMKPEKVAAIGYKALMKRKTSVIAGVYNKLLVASTYLLPEKFINFLSKKMLKK